MNTQLMSSFKRFTTTMSAILLVAALLLPACTGQPQRPRVEEITFQSGEFTLVGELRTPAGTGPFPVVLFVHGDAPADRTLFGLYLPIMERMLRAGYAVFSWDNPGIGKSTGTTDRGQIIKQQAQIVLDAMKVLQDQGYWPMSDAEARIQREPGLHTPLSAWPYAPGYLDLLEEWLSGLP